AEKKSKRDALRAADAKRLTFDQASAMFLKNKTKEFRNAKHAAQWTSTLKEYASPLIGALPVSDIVLAHAVKVLEPHWLTKTESMTRLRGRCEKVLDWAKVGGYRDGENPFRWRGNLDVILPKPTKIKK